MHVCSWKSAQEQEKAGEVAWCTAGSNCSMHAVAVASKQAAGGLRASRPPAPPAHPLPPPQCRPVPPRSAPAPCAMFESPLLGVWCAGQGSSARRTALFPDFGPSFFLLPASPAPLQNTAPSIVPASDHRTMESEGGAVPPPVQPGDFLKDIQAPDLPPSGAFPHCRTSCAAPPAPPSRCCGCRPAAPLSGRTLAQGLLLAAPGRLGLRSAACGLPAAWHRPSCGQPAIPPSAPPRPPLPCCRGRRCAC